MPLPLIDGIDRPFPGNVAGPVGMLSPQTLSEPPYLAGGALMTMHALRLRSLR